MSRPSRIEICVDQLIFNWQEIVKYSGRTFLCPMVKSDGYGHGAEIVVTHLAKMGCRQIGVALTEEAVDLREKGFSAIDILVFGSWSPKDLKVAGQYDLTPVLSRYEELQMIEDCSLAHPLKVHIKVNTGLNRMGLDDDPVRVRQALSGLQSVRLSGLCTHLLHGDDVGQVGGHSDKQIQKFARWVAHFPPETLCHVYNSAGLMGALFNSQVNSQSKEHGYGSRPGGWLYGLLPKKATTFGVCARPVMSLLSEVVKVHRVKRGSSVSYDGGWVAKKDSWIATVPLGYGDGLNRSFVENAKPQMLYRGKRVPVSGPICMDYCMLDVTDAVTDGVPQEGEQITVLGQQGQEQITAQDWAKWCGTVAYDVTTGLHQRLPRKIVRQISCEV